MEKRTVLAVVLMMAVVIIWSIFFAPHPPVRQVETENNVIQGQSETPPLPATDAGGNTRTTSMPTAVTSTPLVETTEVHVDTGVAHITLTSQGAGVKGVRLQAFHTTLEKNSPLVEIAPKAGTLTFPLTTELVVGPQAAPITLGQVGFVPEGNTNLLLSAHNPQGQITFRSTLANGTLVRRLYHFTYGSYMFDVKTQVEGWSPQTGQAMTTLWGPGLLEHNDEGVRQGQTAVLPRSYIGGKVFQEVPEKPDLPILHEGPVAWTALGDTYFTAALIPQRPGADAVLVRKSPEGILTVGVRTPVTASSAEQAIRVYVGPKEQPLLTQAEPSLDKLIDLGYFSPLARPMLQLLRWVNSWIGNYGVTIILVTFLIKIVLWPLTHKSYKSMQAMQKLQPKIQELQALYKNDRDGLNRAMMQLYRDQKVNPMGGCLPMLLQIPVFFAFYNALLYAIELRHAPFICWDKAIWGIHGICDLSVRDPSYVTPVLMGISMFVQQKMTPTTGDPTQAKIMQFMPLIFVFFFFSAPAGLVIYWLVNNVLGIGQQLWTNHLRRQEEAQPAKA